MWPRPSGFWSSLLFVKDLVQIFEDVGVSVMFVEFFDVDIGNVIDFFYLCCRIPNLFDSHINPWIAPSLYGYACGYALMLMSRDDLVRIFSLLIRSANNRYFAGILGT